MTIPFLLFSQQLTDAKRSSFIPHPSSFTFHPSSFTLHPFPIMLAIPATAYRPSGRPAASRDRLGPPTPPPPPPPPGPPRVVSVYFGGNTVVMTFDQPVVLTGDSPDDAVTVNGMTPSSATMADEYTLSLAMPGFVEAGEPWAISRQPAWVVTEIQVPEDGVL
jgi:hypothetical protein